MQHGCGFDVLNCYTTDPAELNDGSGRKDTLERHAIEGLTEDELEIFDLLKKDSLTLAETQKVKLAAKALLRRLQSEAPRVLVQDWYKTDQTRRVVRLAVAEVTQRITRSEL